MGQDHTVGAVCYSIGPKCPGVSAVATNAANLRYLIDSYLVWAAGENIPLVEGAAADLNAIETAPWPRLGGGCRGAFVHLLGRGDFVALQVIDIPPGGKTDQVRHLYDEVFHVLAGQGSASVDLGNGETRSFDWGPRALFSPPLNAPFRLINTSREDTARLVCASDLPFVMNVYRNEKFVFDNPFPFPERAGRDAYFAGEGDFLALKPGTHMWETNFVPDVGTLALAEWAERGAGSRNVNIVLADSSMHVHVSELPAGTYNKGRYGAGPHVFPVTGAGYTLVWNEGDAEFERHDWRHGVAFVAPHDRLHQHFNTGAEPARHLAVSLGSRRYPVLSRIAKRNLAPEAAVKDGGLQVDFEDQDARIHPMWLAELAQAGVTSRMDTYAAERRKRP
jgi:mannose-6-phosphate isomerase-like protein (cupin superfamily)